MNLFNFLFAKKPEKQNQIQRLISEGDISGAIDLMPESVDKMLLKARYASGKKQYNIGFIEFAEWQRVREGICQEILKQVK